jgi:DNA-binding MarR family transcriptional regulator
MSLSKRQDRTRPKANRAAGRSFSKDKARTDSVPRFVDGYLPYLLARASHLISGEFHATLEKERIPVMHWRVLCSLLDAPMSVSELAAVVIAKQPTMSKLLARMEAQGLIARETDPADGRGVLVSIAPPGRQLVQPLIGLAKQHEASVLGPLGGGNASTLITILSKLIQQHT